MPWHSSLPVPRSMVLQLQLKVAPTTLTNQPITSSTTALKQYKKQEPEDTIYQPLSYSQVVKLRRGSHDPRSHLTWSRQQSCVQSHEPPASQLSRDQSCGTTYTKG